MQSAELFAFPAERRGALVRRTARDLQALNGEDANRYWRSTARSLYQELLSQGLDDGAARTSVGRFSDAVQTLLREELPLSRSSVTA